MRIGEDHIRQELEKTLDALEIRGASKEKLMEYLDPDKPGDESLWKVWSRWILAGRQTRGGVRWPAGRDSCPCRSRWPDG